MKGSYSVEKGIIRCPWHGACFNISNGDIEDFPGLDSLPKYEVEQQNDGNIRIKGHYNINSVSKRHFQIRTARTVSVKIKLQ